MRKTLIPAALALLVAVPAHAADEPAYLDDGSTPELLIRSFYNAVDRFELPRAWGYLNPDFRPEYEDFFAEFGRVKSVELVFGFLQGYGRAGGVDYTLPVIVQLVDDKGEYSYQTGCIGVVWPFSDPWDPPPYAWPYVSYYNLDKAGGPASQVPLTNCD